jgi:nifR3 family TIM-barrel protein
MAGVTDHVFRQLCKEQGADVMVTEFVSAEGILRRNERTCEYLQFTPDERPLGVQLFGADPEHLGEAARSVIEWVQPDFIDLNFGCPVNKVVSKLGGSALLRDCPLLGRVASAVVKAAGNVPVTGKIRIGWSAATVNAVETTRVLEDCGIQAVAVHGRTKEQGYSGQADWDVIGEVAASAGIPIIGNGDISGPLDVELRRAQTKVAGIMIGRAAMTAPWIFRTIKHYVATAEILPDLPLEEKWAFIQRHARAVVSASIAGGRSEQPAMHSLRARLMAYSRGMPGGRHLRGRLQSVSSLSELETIAGEHAEHSARSLQET